MLIQEIGVLPDETLVNFIKLIRLSIKYPFPFNEKFEEFANQIENEALTKLADNRINSYGGWEEAEKHFLSEDEFMAKIGVTEADIENAEDIELI
ncbi:MAG: hypothetical protein LBL87_01265 [Ruminococcus sp.]|nr:hypothetical protein [Ruminococcus sp.]